VLKREKITGGDVITVITGGTSTKPDQI